MKLGDLVPAVYILGMIGIFGGVMLKVLNSLNLTGDAGLFVGNVTSAFTNLGSDLGLVGTIIALSVVMTVVISAFSVGFGRQE